MSSSHAFPRETAQQPVSMPPPKPVAGETFKHSETTRLLCASAYLDREFRDLVIKFCLESRHHALGACFGLDMPTVVRHCRRAKRIFGRRRLLLLVPGLVAVIAGLTLLSSTPEQLFNAPSLGGYVALAFILYCVAFAICLYFESRARSIVTQNFRRGNFKPEAFLQGDTTPVEYLQAAETGNAVIYSGFTPFVGSGENVGAWSFALDLRKRAGDATGNAKKGANQSQDLSESELEGLTIEALYGYVAKNIAALGLERVTVQDKLYVNGQDIRDDERFLRHPLDRPRYRVDEVVMQDSMIEQQEKHLRHYRCIRVVDWSGELVLSIFLRFSKLSHNLFVEASYYLLMPVAERFRAVDAMSPKFRLGRFMKMVLETALKAPFLTLWAPFAVLGGLIERFKLWSARREEDERIEENPSFDYGAAFSFRQWASSPDFRRYFQRLDKEMYLKVLEKNILDSVLTFLEEHDVDVSELKQRQTTILNQGLILSGGNVTTQNMSVGLGAKVENVAQKVTNFAAKASGPAARAS